MEVMEISPWNLISRIGQVPLSVGRFYAGVYERALKQGRCRSDERFFLSLEDVKEFISRYREHLLRVFRLTGFLEELELKIYGRDINFKYYQYFLDELVFILSGITQISGMEFYNVYNEILFLDFFQNECAGAYFEGCDEFSRQFEIHKMNIKKSSH